MAMRPFTAIVPDAIHPPFGNYSHGVLVSGDVDWLVTSGELGISKDGAIPGDVEAQADLCFRNIGAVLAAAGMTFADLVRLSAFVTRRSDFPAYMRVRDRFVQAPLPASTLLIVSGFTREEMLVEVEATAVRVRGDRPIS